MTPREDGTTPASADDDAVEDGERGETDTDESGTDALAGQPHSLRDGLDLPEPPEQPTPKSSEAFLKFRQRLEDSGALVPQVEPGSDGSQVRVDSMAAIPEPNKDGSVEATYSPYDGFTKVPGRAIHVQKVDRAEGLDKKEQMAGKAGAILQALTDVLQNVYRSDESPFHRELGQELDSPVYSTEAVTDDSAYQQNRDVMQDALGHLRNTLRFREGDTAEDMLYCLGRVHYALDSLSRNTEDVAGAAEDGPMIITPQEALALREFLQVAMEGLIEAGDYRDMGIYRLATPEWFGAEVASGVRSRTETQAFADDVLAGSLDIVNRDADTICQEAFGFNVREIIAAATPDGISDEEVARRTDQIVAREVARVVADAPFVEANPVDRSSTEWQQHYRRLVVDAVRRHLRGQPFERQEEKGVFRKKMEWVEEDPSDYDDDYIMRLARDLADWDEDDDAAQEDVPMTVREGEDPVAVVRPQQDRAIYIDLAGFRADTDQEWRRQTGTAETRTLSVEDLRAARRIHNLDPARATEENLRRWSGVADSDPTPRAFKGNDGDGRAVIYVARAVAEADVRRSDGRSRSSASHGMRRDIDALLKQSTEAIVDVQTNRVPRTVEGENDSPLARVVAQVSRMPGGTEHMARKGAVMRARPPLTVTSPASARPGMDVEAYREAVYATCLAPEITTRVEGVIADKTTALHGDVGANVLRDARKVYGLPVVVPAVSSGAADLRRAVENTKDLDISSLLGAVTIDDVTPRPATPPVVVEAAESADDDDEEPSGLSFSFDGDDELPPFSSLDD